MRAVATLRRAVAVAALSAVSAAMAADMTEAARQVEQAERAFARFNSIWPQESPSVWRVVFDKGSPPSAAELKAEPP